MKKQYKLTHVRGGYVVFEIDTEELTPKVCRELMEDYEATSEVAAKEFDKKPVESFLKTFATGLMEAYYDPTVNFPPTDLEYIQWHIKDVLVLVKFEMPTLNFFESDIECKPIEP